jgi:alkaline phosphatase D
MKRDSLHCFPRISSALSRRTFLRGSALAALALAAGMAPRRAAGLTPASIPFSLGVASGDPTHESVVLWTRLAVDPLNGGGMPHVPIEVGWKIATDPHLRHLVRHGVSESRQGRRG